MAIENRSAWDKHMSFNQDKVLTELRFWENNISKLNSRQLGVYSKSSVVIYSDASNVAAGAYTVEVESKLFHKMCSVNERAESSTWRKLKAIDLALSCFKDSFQGKTIKWFTDSQNCVKIVNAGSMKEKLHSLALSIFSTCVEKGISIDIQWIPRTENEKADYISKMFDFEDWGLTLHFLWIKCGDHARSIVLLALQTQNYTGSTPYFGILGQRQLLPFHKIGFQKTIG